MRDRILDINPQAKVTIHPEFFLPENEDQFPFETYDYIVDAVDTVAAKIALAVKAKEMNIPIIASMGAGNKLDPTRFRVSDISKTETDPLARVIRREMKHRGITSLKVVWSDEKPIKLPEPAEPQEVTERPSGMRRATPGSVAFVPSVAGLVIAGEVIRDLVAAGEK